MIQQRIKRLQILFLHIVKQRDTMHNVNANIAHNGIANGILFANEKLN